ncbi:MAG TPA: efflux transporter outer membrane subunit [Sedimentisphaerales bacterium]|nr:efflux transporter outer membrane subunit [Sedimentisphaerales bacterium]
MKRKLASICGLFFVLGCAMYAGCMVGPDYSRPETPAETSGAYFHAGLHKQDVNDCADADRWWEGFGDPTTAQLVRRALENNYDIKAAAARVLQAQAALAEMRGRQRPDVSYNISRDRSKRSFNLGGGPFGGRFSVMSTTWSQDITVNYILDLFGKLKHAERAAWADMLASEASEQALTNSIIAGVINSRINIATIQRRLSIARANTESRQSTLEIVERRYAQGLVGPVDIRLARENLAASKAAEPAVELSLITARHALDVLLARPPGSSEDLPETLEELPDLEPVPIGVPARLLDRRPDVKTAELALRSANERIGVSIAQLYPDLSLTGSYGANADRWRDIWESYSETYGLLMRLAQPIFKGGQIRAQIDAAKARYAELAANYAGTVLTAMREVEDALVSEQMLQNQLQHTGRRFLEAKAAEELSRQRYQQGLTGFLVVLETERRRRIAEEQLTILKGQIWATRVNLYLALGGDWNEQEEEILAAGKNEKK